jgi:mannan endo-1,4-beta-mannosidase
LVLQARRYGIRVILSVLDNWKYSGGIDEFVDWSATSPRRERERPADAAGDNAGGVCAHK